MNKFKKYAPTVWVMETGKQYQKGDFATIDTKYGKEVEVEVFNFVAAKNDLFYYSVLRTEEESYAERKAKKYQKSADLHNEKSTRHYEDSQEGRDFLSLGEPIKVGHHSEARHRALIERNDNRMRKSVEEYKIADKMSEKADYWVAKAKKIDLSMPESLEHFTEELVKAKEYHAGLKSGKYPKLHSYDVQYANKKVKDLTKKVDLAERLWGERT